MPCTASRNLRRSKTSTSSTSMKPPVLSKMPAESRLRHGFPGLQWEVTNQATAHLWFAREFGQAVTPPRSLEEGVVATWPEFATCVGVLLDEEDSIAAMAPHGLDDLFNLRVRHNPLRASVATYRQRVESKRFPERLPRLSIARY